MQKQILSLSESCVDVLGKPGRLISSSKGQYRWDNPENFVVFNANIVNSKGEKVWYGDIDITKELDKLVFISGQSLGQLFYVLPESAARFEYEAAPKLEEFLVTVQGNDIKVGSKFSDYVIEERDAQGVLTSLTIKKSEEKPLELPKVDYNREDYQELMTLSEEEKADIILYEGEDFIDYANYFDMKNCFKNIDDLHGPLHKFWDFAKQFLRNSGIDDSDPVSVVYISQEDYGQLKNQVEYWLRAFNPESTEYRIKTDLGWIMLAYGPSCFQGTPDWADSGKMYAKKKK